jgi:hypothetical protein
MNSLHDLQPHQILCLDHEATSLYGEVIQIITERHLCWFRPLALLQRESHRPDAIETLYDLRQGADLLYPVSFFRAALDVEVLPILMQLDHLKVGQNAPSSTHVQQPDDQQIAHQQLQRFVRQIWQAQPDAFRQ